MCPRIARWFCSSWTGRLIPRYRETPATVVAQHPSPTHCALRVRTLIRKIPPMMRISAMDVPEIQIAAAYENRRGVRVGAGFTPAFKFKNISV